MQIANTLIKMNALLGKPISTLTGFTCNFQTNLCRMRQARDDQFDWIRSRGTTRTGGTGPSRDFTEVSWLQQHHRRNTFETFVLLKKKQSDEM